MGAPSTKSQLAGSGDPFSLYGSTGLSHRGVGGHTVSSWRGEAECVQYSNRLAAQKPMMGSSESSWSLKHYSVLRGMLKRMPRDGNT
jgi:hypothetical protein